MRDVISKSRRTSVIGVKALLFRLSVALIAICARRSKFRLTNESHWQLNSEFPFALTLALENEKEYEGYRNVLDIANVAMAELPCNRPGAFSDIYSEFVGNRKLLLFIKQ